MRDEEPRRLDRLPERATHGGAAPLAAQRAGENVQRALAAVRQRELLGGPPDRPGAARGSRRDLGGGGGATELVGRSNEVGHERADERTRTSTPEGTGT